ncbi:hypothetical protein ACHQM5_016821 [Ranunculus cassubicifolius]
MEFFFLVPFFTFVLLLLKPCSSATIVVDGVAEWKNPSVLVGDTIIFQHRQHLNLYIFHDSQAFKLCNFTQAVLLTHPNSNSFTWHPSRAGVFYFLFSNTSVKVCNESNQLPIKVTLRLPEIAPSTSPEVAPSPASGGIVSSSPAKQVSPLSSTPSLSPTPATTTSPILPGKGGGMPFINSNPAVPLPTEADAATVHSLPISESGKVVGLILLQFPLSLLVWFML